MPHPIQFLLKNKFKRASQQKPGGFTLIEVLVAIIIASLVITPLLGFMISILRTDRQEQAKATTEQEIQSALNYIAEDLQQSVYIYDKDSLYGETDDSTNPPTVLYNKIVDQLPPEASNDANNGGGCAANECIPVLVFWKRDLRKDILPIGGADCGTNPEDCDDTFVYSLVAYYIVKGDSSNPTWSNAARIARFEISNAVEIPNPSAPTTTLTLKDKDPGFAMFDLGGDGTLKQKMNKWEKGSGNYNVNFGNKVLVDYVDQSPKSIPSTACDADEQLVPNQGANIPTGLYACVTNPAEGKNSARVYIRGNALARIQNSNIEYSASKDTYFPTASVEVEARGFLSTK